ncbi:glycosyltransferase [Pseudoxanthomonas sp. SGNA-20]|uniref:glycosyltransferase family 4 protein n=1 Tax=Pseudoxanthomonas sp. SGNA-20 TaxID=2493088 RepID=UPI000F631D2B|nr:glycosyltransferase family 4 protein [Pseudoxanthomonas sp. SGNA-20]RRN58792.1 glycosyltransferase [Pseudoxanthomonas sp. SGNA-20]
MKVLVLTKRQYTAKDLLNDRYGRLYELPEALARQGHEVTGLTTSYRSRTSTYHLSPAGVDWHSINASPLAPLEWAGQLRKIEKPDVIWASSDAPHCIAAAILSKRWDVPAVLDLYDNYDYFGLTRIPGITTAFHRACRSAAHLTMASHTLASHVRERITMGVPVTVIPNGVRTDLFRPMARRHCREVLGLPPDACLVGTVGAIHRNRGIGDLFEAFDLLAKEDPNLHLVIAGPRDKTIDRYRSSRILDLGIIDWRQVPTVINALDIAVVCNRNDGFGKYCHPLKLTEALACGVPVCAAETGDAALLLSNNPEALYTPGDPYELAQQIHNQLTNTSKALAPKPDSWKKVGEKLASCLHLATTASERHPAL